MATATFDPKPIERKEGQCFNLHVLGLIHRFDRVIREILHSQSASLVDMRVADFERFKKYIVELRSYAQYISAVPELDFCKSHPLADDLPPIPALPRVENDSLFDLANLFWTFRYEMANAASAGAPSGLSKPDSARVMSYLDNAEQFLLTHVAKLLPMDYPETSPLAPHAGQGNLGA
jgi:hypothetical protein